MEKETEKEKGGCKKGAPSALYHELRAHGALGRAAREFGLEYLEGEAPGSSVTPRAMRELDGRVSAMGLTPRGAFRLAPSNTPRP